MVVESGRVTPKWQPSTITNLADLPSQGGSIKASLEACMFAYGGLPATKGCNCLKLQGISEMFYCKEISGYGDVMIKTRKKHFLEFMTSPLT
jgi:hypothetical protein